ncbi:FecR domain-containing protein [Undibacterium cyanobacteriorum]|uniref:FecR domain-containing protein n=1 Tax=Undibacterium cyanobacteriorum TaxID=3073561 RepID=A0ABY9RIW9_9BURK|nr:FecR domain-containing protein [Undibacterium sp. 20NA77.5]WMW81172.1 FecR domain-containing protein [Undibacterium sp. 20NA77.5]
MYPLTPTSPGLKHTGPHSFRFLAIFHKLNLISLCIILCLGLGAFNSFSHAQTVKSKGKPGSTEIVAGDLVYYAQERDTLMSLAKQFTDKTAHWEAIGKRNNISNERAIPIGSAVIIPAELLTEEPAPARVAALAGTVSVIAKNGKEEVLAVGSILAEGSQINTGKNGFVTLALVDESRVSIPSNSQALLAKIRVTKFTKSPRTEIKLLDGRVESQVSKLEANKGRFEVRSKLAIAGVRGTHFRVGVNETGIANEVLEGGVAVGQVEKPNALVLPAGQGNIVSSSGVGQPIKLLAPPRLVDGYQLQAQVRPEFKVEAVENGVDYRAQITRDAQALDVVAESMAQNQQFQFPEIADGQYFLRVTAIDTHRLEGMPSIFPFKVKATPAPPFPLAPKHKIRIKTVEFKWTSIPNARSYHLQVAKDAAFQQLVLDQDQIATNNWKTDAISLGDYYWRVATVMENESPSGKQVDQGPYSGPQSFRVLAGQTVHPFVDKGSNTLEFTWPSESGQRFLVQVASDVEFKKILFNQEVNQAKALMPRPESGFYYIRVRATDADRFIGAFSEPQKFEIGLRWTTGTGDALQSSSGSVTPSVK